MLIAFGVLALMLVPILQIFGGGIGSSQTARGYAMAALLARSKLAELATGATFAEGETSGTFEGADGFRWRTTIARDTSPIALPPETIAQVDDPAAASNRPGAAGSASRGADSGAKGGFGNRSGGFGGSGSGLGSSLGDGRGTGSGNTFGSQSGTDGGFGSQSGFATGRSGSGSEQQRSGFGTAGRTTGSTAVAGSGEAGDGEAGAAQDELIAYKVTVTVNWGPPSGSGAVTLSTLRLGRQPEDGGTSLQ